MAQKVENRDVFVSIDLAEIGLDKGTVKSNPICLKVKAKHFGSACRRCLQTMRQLTLELAISFIFE